MLGDLLLKIEKLHEFVDDCVSSGSLSLIDKDIILQNIRDIYVDASRIDLGDFDDNFDDDFENENIILFDSSEPLKQIEITLDEQNGDQANDEELLLDSAKQELIDNQQDSKSESQIENEPQTHIEPLIEEQEQVVYMSSGDNDLEMSISDYEKDLIIRELCSMDESKYSKLIDKLNSFAELDDVLIYISEEFPASQNSEAAVLLADKMAERLS